MRMYFPGELAPGRACALPPPQAHHAVRVLRLKVGDAVILFNGDGAEYAAVIVVINRDRFALDVTGCERVDREAPLAVTLAQAVSSGERMDYTVQKAVELGVARIEPVVMHRGVVRLDPERARQKQAHWQAVAVAACEQCGRNRLPEIAPVRRFDEWLAQWRRRSPAAFGVLLDPGAARRLADLPRPAGGITLLAGPEGGYSDDERQVAQRAGCVPVRLGPRVLRTETAALSALAAMQALWGDY